MIGRTLVAWLVVGAVAVSAPLAAAGASEPKAFTRAKRPSDVLTQHFPRFTVVDSRRVATHSDRRGRSAALRLFAGIAANEVTRVVLVGSRGVRHRLQLSSDGGFIYDCRAYNGCACLVARLDAHDDQGKRVTHESWLSPTCRRR